MVNLIKYIEIVYNKRWGFSNEDKAILKARKSIQRSVGNFNRNKTEKQITNRINQRNKMVRTFKSFKYNVVIQNIFGYKNFLVISYDTPGETATYILNIQSKNNKATVFIMSNLGRGAMDFSIETLPVFLDTMADIIIDENGLCKIKKLFK